MNDTIKIARAFEDFIILLKEITKAIENETNEQKGGLLGVLLGTLVASLLGKMLPGKRIVRTGYENKEGKRILRAGFGSKKN